VHRETRSRANLVHKPLQNAGMATSLSAEPGGAPVELASPMERARRTLTILLLIITSAVGGNGSDLLDFAAEAIAIFLLFATLGSPRLDSRLPGRLLRWMIVLLVMVPLAQMIPLPINAWRMLPGRDLAYAIQAQAGALYGSHAISLAPALTRQTALRLLPAIAMFLSVLRADTRERRLLILFAIALCLLDALIGVVQFSTGALYLFATPHEGSSVGIFVNRNHQADALMAGMFLIAGLGRERASARVALVFFSALIILLALCVVTTTSRMGNAIMPFATLVSLSILLGRRDRRRYWVAALAAPIFVGAGLLLLDNSVIQHTIGRFAGSDEDSRYGFWTDTIVAIRQYWPVGSGVGTFVPIYATVESLDNVTSAYVNHAHNEYLETVLEAGVAAVLLIAGYFAILLNHVRQVFGARDWPIRAAGLGLIIVVLMHSFVDYPLRTLSLSTLFGLANALLVGCANRPDLRHSTRRSLPASADFRA
jgi:O-antigen ligase